MPREGINCNLSTPYPCVTKTKLNSYDLRMLRVLLSRKLSQISEYLLQSALLAAEHLPLSEMLECIALCEIKHFKLLASLLHASGESVGISSLTGKRAGRTAVSGEYAFDLPVENVLSSLLEAERASVSDLRLVLSQINDEVARKLLLRILADEEHHAEVFANLMVRYQ